MLETKQVLKTFLTATVIRLYLYKLSSHFNHLRNSNEKLYYSTNVIIRISTYVNMCKPSPKLYSVDIILKQPIWSNQTSFLLINEGLLFSLLDKKVEYHIQHTSPMKST